MLEADRRWAPGVCRREVGAPDRLAGADVDRLPGRKVSSLTTELIMSSTLVVFVVDAKWSAKLIWTVSPSLSGADLAGVMSYVLGCLRPLVFLPSPLALARNTDKDLV